MSWELYHELTHNGDFVKTHYTCDPEKVIDEIYDFKFVKYNPSRPEILRDGLSVTSYDGGLSGYPDLHSLKDVYEETGESFSEEECTVLTPVYHDCPEVQKMCDPWLPWLKRTHFLKLPPGGFFPDHVDGGRIGNPTSFRLIVPIFNCNPPEMIFLVKPGTQYEVLNWEHGRTYFLNTSKRHLLFNASSEDSIMLVMNIAMTRESVQKLRYKVY